MIRDICFLGGGTYNTISDMCSRAGEHISLVIPVPGWCCITRETDIIMCFPGRETHITSDMHFLGRGNTCH